MPISQMVNNEWRADAHGFPASTAVEGPIQEGSTRLICRLLPNEPRRVFPSCIRALHCWICYSAKVHCIAQQIRPFQCKTVRELKAGRK